MKEGILAKYIDDAGEVTTFIKRKRYIYNVCIQDALFRSWKLRQHKEKATAKVDKYFIILEKL